MWNRQIDRRGGEGVKEDQEEAVAGGRHDAELCKHTKHSEAVCSVLELPGAQQQVN